MKILLEEDYILIYDPNYQINENELNSHFIALMDKINGNHQIVERAKRKGNYLVINQYANIRGKILINVFKEFLKKSKINYNWNKKLSNEDKKLFNKIYILPNVDFALGETGGGVTPDTRQIENGIKPLVVAINEFKDIKTFGSCEGHNDGNLCRAYVVWTTSSLDGLNHFTFILNNAINKVWKKIDDVNFSNTQMSNKILLTFHTSFWLTKEKEEVIYGGPQPKENFYKFEFTYNFKYQNFVFNIIEDIALEIKNTK